MVVSIWIKIALGERCHELLLDDANVDGFVGM
jgi:hypothetical protein